MRGGSWGRGGWRRKRRRRRDACVHLVRRELGDAGNGPLVALHLFATRSPRVLGFCSFEPRVTELCGLCGLCASKCRYFCDLPELAIILHTFWFPNYNIEK
jgi:hypothetical protein